MEIVIKSENSDYEEYEDYYEPDLEIKQEIHESSDEFHPNSLIKEEWDTHEENNPEGFLDYYEQGNLLEGIVIWSVAA